MSWKKGRPTAGTTTSRGYGTNHARARAIAMAAFRDGDLCGHCRKPMYRTQKLHLDHTPDRTAYRGLAHARCNLSDGARRGRQRQQQAATRYSNVW